MKDRENTKEYTQHNTGLKVSTDGEVYVPEHGRIKGYYTYGTTTLYGHKQVCFKRKIYLVHRLVAETYLNNNQPLSNDYHVHHINGNPEDNRVENLQILTHEEHIKLHNKGKYVTEETRQKLSKANTGKQHTEETKQKLSKLFSGDKHPMYGKHFTEEQKHNMSEAKKGNKNPMFGKFGADNPKSKPITGINLKTDEVVDFPSAAEAARTLGINHSAINQCLRGKIKTAYGYKWHYKENV